MSRESHPSWGALIAVVALSCVAAGCGDRRTPSKAKRVPIVITVDFGPAGKPAREEYLLVDAGSTPKDAVSILFPIQSGDICCNTREIASIDGIRPDPAHNRWWTCRLNGSPKLSPFRTVLKANDRVEWRYIEQSQ